MKINQIDQEIDSAVLWIPPAEQSVHQSTDLKHCVESRLQAGGGKEGLLSKSLWSDAEVLGKGSILGSGKMK